jgi:hypothetical protein
MTRKQWISGGRTGGASASHLGGQNSSLNHEIGYRDQDLRGSSQSFQANTGLHHNRFLPHPLQFIILQ